MTDKLGIYLGNSLSEYNLFSTILLFLVLPNSVVSDPLYIYVLLSLGAMLSSPRLWQKGGQVHQKGLELAS